MKNTIIKVSKNDTKYTKLLIFFSTKCIEKGFFLPYSYLKVLVIIHYFSSVFDRNNLADIIVKNRILFSNQSALNVFSTLCKFGIIEKSGVGMIELSNYYKPPKILK